MRRRMARTARRLRVFTLRDGGLRRNKTSKPIAKVMRDPTSTAR